MRNLQNISAWSEEEGILNVIIETPKGNGCKVNYDPRRDFFHAVKCLPSGMHFPYDFGFIPGTRGEDGDPLDVLLMFPHQVFPGCLLPVHPIGVLEAEQTQHKGINEHVRNDRIIGRVDFCPETPWKNLHDMDEKLLKEIEQFFTHYNELEGKKFKSLGWHGSQRAKHLIEEGIRKYKQKEKQKKLAS